MGVPFREPHNQLAHVGVGWGLLDIHSPVCCVWLHSELWWTVAASVVLSTLLSDHRVRVVGCATRHRLQLLSCTSRKVPLVPHVMPVLIAACQPHLPTYLTCLFLCVLPHPRRLHDAAVDPGTIAPSWWCARPARAPTKPVHRTGVTPVRALTQTLTLTLTLPPHARAGVQPLPRARRGCATCSRLATTHTDEWHAAPGLPRRPRVDVLRVVVRRPPAPRCGRPLVHRRWLDVLRSGHSAGTTCRSTNLATPTRRSNSSCGSRGKMGRGGWQDRAGVA